MTRRDFTRNALLFFGSQLGLKAIADAEIVQRLGFEPRDTLNLLLDYVSSAPLRARIRVTMKPDRPWPEWTEYIDLPAIATRGGIQVSCPVPFAMEDVWAFRVSIEAVDWAICRTRILEFSNMANFGEWEHFSVIGPGIGEGVVRRKAGA